MTVEALQSMGAVTTSDLPAEPPIDIVLQFVSQSLTYRAKCFFEEATPLVPQRFIPEAVRGLIQTGWSTASGHDHTSTLTTANNSGCASGNRNWPGEGKRRAVHFALEEPEL